jgi:serine phosphatase RsbU (regulator of sigma subunit)
MIRSLWQKISYLGLSDQTEESEFREIILLNKMAIMSFLLILPVIPLEILMNGWMLVPYELTMCALILVTLWLTYKERFDFAKIYFFFMSMSVVFGMSLAVGKGAGNEYFLIPCFIVPLLVFRDLKKIIVLCTTAVVAFFILVYLQKVVEPVFKVPMEVKESLKPIFIVIIFALLFFAFFYFKSINLRFEEILSFKNNEISLKNKEIIDSINYAKRIQNAIIPSAKVVNEALPDSFILYKPKDIVAGDFYWIEDQKDLVLFAAADCTGHGVPGAMVSVVCHNALNRAVREFGKTEPAEILNTTRHLVVEQFEKSEDEVKDGMDIALCAWNKRTNELQFAGANNSLWVIRTGAKEVEEVKADKQPIGLYAKEKPFSGHRLQLDNNDRLYIFTDGYADQFGGSAGKKYKTKLLKNLLLKTANLSMKDQIREVDKEFESWRGGLEQVDDVCIIGLRV